MFTAVITKLPAVGDVVKISSLGRKATVLGVDPCNMKLKLKFTETGVEWWKISTLHVHHGAGNSWRLRFKEGTLKSVSAINILGIVNSPPVKYCTLEDTVLLIKEPTNYRESAGKWRLVLHFNVAQPTKTDKRASHFRSARGK
ncbi:hypothetical protein NC651_033060 [Populus alba x Populus x berolinensis]|nr:hypothetical protein NC651_033060 [Populus alba x Populus x berolinensis]